MTKSKSQSVIKSHSSSLAAAQKSKLPRENLRIMSRIINAPTGVPSVDKLNKDYQKHKQRVKTIQRIAKVQTTVRQTPAASTSMLDDSLLHSPSPFAQPVNPRFYLGKQMQMASSHAQLPIPAKSQNQSYNASAVKQLPIKSRVNRSE